jgi:Primase zinc finger
MPETVHALQDGLRCTVGVNVAKCPFCDFHVAKEYKKMAPRRGGFTDSLLPTGFSRSSASGQPCKQGDRGQSSLLSCQPHNAWFLLLMSMRLTVY